MLELTLENYRRYRTPTRVQFVRGLTVISGENGAGKTTLTEAILHALFGPKTGPTVQADGTDQPFNIMLNLGGQGVGLEIVVRGAHYQVHVEGQEQVSFGSGSQPVARRVVQQYLGGLGRKNFERVYFTLQGETHALVALPAAQRKSLIEEVLQLDTVKGAVRLQKDHVDAQCREVQARISATVHVAIQSAVGQGLEALARTVQNSGNSNTRNQALGSYRLALQQADEQQAHLLREDEQERDAVKETLASATTDAEQCRQAFLVVEERERQFRDLQRAASEADHAVELQNKVSQGLERTRGQDERELLAARNAEPEARQHDQTLQEITTLDTALTEHLRQRAVVVRLREAQADLGKLTARMSGFDRLDDEQELHREELLQAEAALQAYQDNPHLSDFNLLEHHDESIELERVKQESALNALLRQDEPSICPTCGNPLNETQRLRRRAELETWLRSTYSNEVQGMATRRQELGTLDQEWQKAKAGASARLKAAYKQSEQDAERITQCLELSKQVQHAEHRVSSIEIECADQQVQFPFDDAQEGKLTLQKTALVQKVSQFKPASQLFSQVAARVVRLEDREEELRLSHVETERLKGIRAAIDYNSGTHAEVLAQLEDAEERRTNANERVRGAKVHLGTLSSQVDKSAADRRLLQQRTGELNQAIVDLQTEEHLLYHLDRFQSHFFDANTREVMQRATGLIRTATAQAIYTLELESDGKLYYRDRTRKKHLASRLSGGEQALVGLCIRLALAEQAQTISTNGRVKFLVLDEVLGNLDDGRRQQVQSIFDTVLAAGKFECIVMITHLDEVKNNWAAHRLEVVKDGASETSSVVSLASTFL